jgi:hypothetical protein
MAVFTNAGLALIATAVQSDFQQAAIDWVGVGAGCGTLATGLTSGVAATALALNAGLPANVATGTGLTITDGTNVQTCTVAAPGASAGATSIPVTSFTPSHTFAINTTGVAPTPLATDTVLYNEVVRIAAAAGVAGANPGESLSSGYFDGTQPSNVYMTVGYFGGSAATSTPGTGTLMIADVQYWNHVLNSDSATFQADSTI